MGSELFERICSLPEYYPTRTESAILQRAAETIHDLTGAVTLVELGSGSSVKTDHLLAAYTARGEELHYVPVDVSASILRVAADRIEDSFPSVNVAGVHGEYEEAFPLLQEFAPTMLLFLGSTVGNMSQAETVSFWRRVARAMPTDSFVLLGVDLVKDRATLEAAYNDRAGVTARFTRNLFDRMNRELGAGIDIDQIEHVATWNATWQRIEISARFTAQQVINIEPLERHFVIQAGERVMTEISRKFVLPKLEDYVACFGFQTVATFTDPKEWFAVLLLKKR